MKTTTDTPKIYVGTYGKYNGGSIAGDWFDLSDYSSRDELLEAIKEFHNDEADPEYMIQDSEGPFVKELGESLDSKTLDAIYELLDSDMDAEIIEAYISGTGTRLTDLSISDVQDAYVGSFDSDEDFAQEMAEQLGYMEQKVGWPFTCIDWEHAARELMWDYSTDSGHYFTNH